MNPNATCQAVTVLLITADTLSRDVDPADRSLRVIVGDGAAASLVTVTADEPVEKLGIAPNGSSSSWTTAATRRRPRTPSRSTSPSPRARCARA